jgi:DNA repair protein SbcD/Mre11
MKILHTADVHLGLKYAGYPSVQSDLSQARFDALNKLVNIANENQCDLFVIAGDLFDHLRVAERDIILAAHILREFHGKLVAVLPGNHDFIVAGDSRLWQKFKSNAGDRTLLLEEKKVYPLKHYDLDVNLYAAPCDSKHSEVNSIGWIDKEPHDSSVRFHIGVGHGSLLSVSPDPDLKFFPMTEEELIKKNIDLWLLGHTDRLQYPSIVSPLNKIFYPGTPEPNGFDCQHEGKAWMIEMNDDKNIIATSLTSGRYAFIQDEVTIASHSDLEALVVKYSNPTAKNILLKLTLKGRIPSEEFSTIGAFEKSLQENVLYLETDLSELRPEITKVMIDKEFTKDSFPYRLLNSFDDSEIDNEAMQIAYEVLKEARV